MPRRTRLAIAWIPWHIIQRGNNRSACFYADEDYRRYLDTLRVFKTLCHARQPYRLMCLSKRPGKWIAICESVRFQFCTGWVQRSEALSIPA